MEKLQQVTTYAISSDLRKFLIAKNPKPFGEYYDHIKLSFDRESEQNNDRFDADQLIQNLEEVHRFGLENYSLELYFRAVSITRSTARNNKIAQLGSLLMSFFFDCKYPKRAYLCMTITQQFKVNALIKALLVDVINDQINNINDKL